MEGFLVFNMGKVKLLLHQVRLREDAVTTEATPPLPSMYQSPDMHDPPEGTRGMTSEKPDLRRGVMHSGKYFSSNAKAYTQTLKSPFRSPEC